MNVIVGSTALERFYMSPRKALDVDLWTSPGNGKYLAMYGYRLDIKEIPTDILKLIPVLKENNCYATPDAVYTIKRSHAMYDIHWDKTINDIIYLQRKGCNLIPELHSKLIEYWKTIHGDKSFLNLNKSKEEFFNDYVNYKIDHDILHTIVSFPNSPLYNQCLRDGKEVLIDKKKFEGMAFTSKLDLFREEIKVIALERWLLPSNFRIPVIKAYRLALKKTITNLTKGWATQFILDNIEEYVRIDNPNWVNNYYNYIGKVIKMHPIIEKIQNKANELDIDDNTIYEAMFQGELVKEMPNENDAWYIKNPEYLEENKKAFEFSEYLRSLNFKVVEQVGGMDEGSYAHTVIEVEGEIFRTDYGYASYDGYQYDDTWDWKPVKSVQKTVTVYE